MTQEDPSNRPTAAAALYLLRQGYLRFSLLDLSVPILRGEIARAKTAAWLHKMMQLNAQRERLERA